jgi:hypothetical protein
MATDTEASLRLPVHPVDALALLLDEPEELEDLPNPTVAGVVFLSDVFERDVARERPGASDLDLVGPHPDVDGGPRKPVVPMSRALSTASPQHCLRILGQALPVGAYRNFVVAGLLEDELRTDSSSVGRGR